MILISYNTGDYIFDMVFLYFILGVVLGVLIPEYVEFLCYFDIVFLRLLNLIIPYMMFPMIVISVSHIMFNIEKDKYLLSVIAYYMVGTLFSILLGFSVAYYYELGLDMDLEDFNISSRDVPQYSFLDILIKIIPENLIAIIYDNNFISLFIVSYLFGIYITYSKYYSFIINVMQKLYDLVMDIVNYVMLLMPYAFLSIAIKLSSGQNSNIALFAQIIGFVIVLYIIRYIILLLEIYFIGGISPWPFILKSFRYQSVAFISTSSKVALPIAVDCMKRMGVSTGSTQYAVSAGSVLNMIGFGIELSLISVFIVNLHGVNIDLTVGLTIIILSFFSCIIGAGIPTAFIVMISLILNFLHIPLGIVSTLVIVDRIIDMFSTTINLTGICASTLVADARLNRLDYKQYSSW